MTCCGCYGTTVITALTSQNTMGVQAVMPTPPEVVESQLRSVFADMRVCAVKTGMIPNAQVARAIVHVLRDERRKRILPIVCDPLMISTSGTPLMDADCIAVMRDELFPLCTLVTPNLPEAQVLGTLPHTPMLVKGGHAESDQMTDILTIPAEDLRRA